jgi:two-component system response regulator MprA
MSEPAVLLVDDDARILRMLERTLAAEGYDVSVAPDGGTALARIERSLPDLIVLDVKMPGLDGLAVTRRLRAKRLPVPILLLTARDAVAERVAGLDAGADDYLVKPFALRELQARLRALLRRVDGPADELRFGDLRLEPSTRDVWRGDRRLELSRTEYALLELFLRHPRQVLERSTVFEQVWGYDFGATSNVLGVYMGYLRRKTEATGEPRLLHTVRGVGYILREEPT